MHDCKHNLTCTDIVILLALFFIWFQWTDDPVFSSQGKYRATTQRQLKEMLYNDIIDYFDKGKVKKYGFHRPRSQGSLARGGREDKRPWERG